LAPLAPRHPRVLRKQDHAPNTGGPAISWLEALKDLCTQTTRETEIDADPASCATERSEPLTQQGDKSAKRGDEWLLSLLAPSHIRDSASHAPGQESPSLGTLRTDRPWLGALESLEDCSTKVEKRRKKNLLPSVEEIPESLVHRGDKSAKSSSPSPDGEAASGNTANSKPKEVRRTLVTAQDQMAGVVADLKDVALVALDLETSGLDPRKNSIRLLSLATKDATYIVDCQSVDPAELFPILTEATVVAHNALFDLGFLSSSGFEPGKVADTMILSQLLYAGSKVEPLKRGQTSHSLDSAVKRELGLELAKTHQSADWGGTLAPEMIEYAAKDVEILIPLHKVLKAKIEEAGLTYVAEIEHRALPTVVWMSRAGVPIDADSWKEHARKTEADAARLANELKALAPAHPESRAWNFGSPQQVRKAAQLLGVDLPNTRDETLALYAKEHEFISALRSYRKAAKLASTYGAAWLENGYHEDGRIYASWRQLRAATGRMACDHPNLQNIPRSGPLRGCANRERVIM
jgi:3'-5' exonuclease/DNA polymerase family A